MRVLGVLPMAGSGSRLAMPFHKALSPTVTADGLQPLYTHSWDRLRRICSEIVFVVSPDGNVDPCLGSLPGSVFVKPKAGELPSSLAAVAKTVSLDTLVAVALPDAVWYPPDGMSRLLAAFSALREPADGVLGLFIAGSDVLDEVTMGTDGFVASITRHTDSPAPDHTVLGWGCLLATAGALRGLTDDRPLGPQLADYRFAAVLLPGPYLDLGTPDRYIAHHDLTRAA